MASTSWTIYPSNGHSVIEVGVKDGPSLIMDHLFVLFTKEHVGLFFSQRTMTADLKEWTLVMMGTSTHPTRNRGAQVPGNHVQLNDQPSNNNNIGMKGSASRNTFSCAGVTTNGICIECKPGFFTLGEECVNRCPEHYFDSVQAVHLASPIKPNFTKPLLHTQGVCKPCHSSCLTCKAEGDSDCYQCASGFERNGNKCEKQMIWDLLDPDVMKHLAWAIILCIAAILLFSVIFGILQAKNKGCLCWRRKPNYFPDWSKGHYDGIVPHPLMNNGADGDSQTAHSSSSSHSSSSTSHYAASHFSSHTTTHTLHGSTSSCTSEPDPPPIPFSFKHFYQYSPRVETV